MHHASRPLIALLAALLCALLTAPAGAEIYRYLDADGNVVFSDEPPPKGTQVQSVDLPQVNTMPAVPLHTPQMPAGDGSSGADGQSIYSSLRIAAPGDDATLRDNTGDIAVRLALEPPLAAGHQLLILLDGVEASRGTQTSATLGNVDRGTHSLQAVVVGAGDGELIRSQTVRVHLMRAFVQPAN